MCLSDKACESGKERGPHMKVQPLSGAVLMSLLFILISNACAWIPPVPFLEVEPEYTAAGEPIILDGSASYAVNAEGYPMTNGINGRGIQRFEWDTDGDGVYDYMENVNYYDGVPDGIITIQFDEPGHYTIRMRVKSYNYVFWSDWEDCCVDVHIGEVIYVDHAAGGNNTGEDWSNAFNYLQDALADANTGDEIWVADGTYYPDECTAEPNGTDDPNSTFQMKEYVSIRGGFAGGESSLSQRNLKTNKAVLNGDINYDNGGEDNGLPQSGNAFHVVTGEDSSRIDGFIIRGGYADGNVIAQYGGGLYNNSDGPEVLNCHFFANYAEGIGGGIYNAATGNLKLANCLISGNAAENIYGGKGGAVYNDAGSIELINCTVSNNIAYETGGIYNSDSNEVVFENCILWDNRDNTNNTPSLSQQITHEGDGLSSAVYSCIQDGNAFDGSVPYGAESNNIDSYPEFVNPGHWDTVSAPNVVVFQAVVRDLQGYKNQDGSLSSLPYAHPDFQNVTGSESGIVGQLLSELVNGKPAYAYGESPPQGSTTHGESWFYHWYNDTEYNLATIINLETSYDESTERFEFRDDHFFPIDDALFDSSGSNMYQCSGNQHYHNFHFTLELHTKFYYDGYDRDIKIYQADDDLWIYIDSKLIIDIGGVHSSEARYCKVEDGDIQFYEDENCTIPSGVPIELNLVSGNTYNFDLFYAERHTVQSHLEFGTTLPLESYLIPGDYHLRESSPCIDAGDNTAVPLSIKSDLDSYQRFVDDPNTEPNGTATVDMGAYEYQVIVAGDDEYSVAKNEELNMSAPGVLANDYDPYENVLECVLETDVSHGLLILDANGAFSYTPDIDYVGMDSFTYAVEDVNSARRSQAASVTINVLQPHQNPIAYDDNVTTMYMTAVDINVLSNDIDPDPCDTLSILSIGQEPLHGTAVINGDHITYTPSVSFGGQDSFTYIAQDSTSLPSNEATVTILIDWVEIDAGEYELIQLPINSVKLRGKVVADSLGRIDICTWSVASVKPGRTVDLDPSTQGWQQTFDSLTTTAEFSWEGSYALKLTAKDEFGQVLDEDKAMIIVRPGPDPNSHEGPIVDAGEYGDIECGDMLELNGTVTDDGYPYRFLDIHWSKDDWPEGAEVIFDDPNCEDTNVAFTKSGSYRLRLWASDGDINSVDYTDIEVLPCNVEPYVNAGPNQVIEPLSPAFIQTSLDGTVSDDGKPVPPGKVSLEWSVVYPWDAEVTFEPNEFVEDPYVTFYATGMHLLKLTADDGQYDPCSYVQIDINQPAGMLAIDAGPNQVVMLPDYAVLKGVVLSGSADSNEWIFLEGPAPVEFEDASALETQVHFIKAGIYKFRLTVTGGIAHATDETTVQVLPGIKLGGGEDHTLVVLEDKTVWSCGGNNFGQLGDSLKGEFKSEKFIIPVLDGDMLTSSGVLENIDYVAAGWKHSLALDEEGHVWAWGDNEYGELGQDNQENSYTPVQVLSGAQPGGLYLSNIKLISTGRSGEHSLAVDSSGNVWSWGRGDDGQLGDGVSGDNHCRLKPVRVLSGEQDPCDENSYLENIIDVSGGAGHFLALDADGHVWTDGNNLWGQLGNGSYIGSNKPVRVLSGLQDGDPCSLTPLENIVAVSAGWSHSMALEKLDRNDPDCRGRVYTWGRNKLGWLCMGCWGGRLGNGQYGYNQNVPIIVLSGEQDPCNTDSFLEDIIVISAGESHCMALDVNGNVWTWGDNRYGQLGIGEHQPEEQFKPVRVIAPNEPNYGSDYLENIVAISAGYWHCLAMDSEGIIRSWGYNGVNDGWICQGHYEPARFGQLGIGLVGVGVTGADRPHRVLMRNRVLNRNKQEWYHTIQSAIDEADNGDEIVVYEGTYGENVDISFKDLILRSTDPCDIEVTKRTIINGAPLYGPGGSGIGINVCENNSIICGFTITNCTIGIDLNAYNFHSPAVTGCILCDNTEAGIRVEGVEPSSPAPIIKNNWIINNNDRGIYLKEIYSPVLIRNNSIVNSNGVGIYFFSGNFKPDIRNCVIYNNAANLHNINNVNYCCINDDPGGTGNITTDPCFVDSCNGDYHIREYSGCKDTGDLNYVWDGNEPDIDGEPRVMFDRIDIGADEYTYIDVNAGSDFDINLLEDANLDGSVVGAEEFTCLWTKLRGPNEVIFENPYDLDTTASFEQMGVYILRLSVYVNNELADWDTIKISVGLGVDAGPDQTVVLPNNTVQLDGNAPGADWVMWTHVSSGVQVYGYIDFNDPCILNPVSTFRDDLYGVFTLQLTAYIDDKPVGSDTVKITVEPPPAIVMIGCPREVNIVGPNVDVDLKAKVFCINKGHVFSTLWSLDNGPNDVAFADANNIYTTATFYENGEYWIKLDAKFDGVVVGSGLAKITVHRYNWPPRVNPGAVENGIVNEAVSLDDAQVWDNNDVSELTLRWELLNPPDGNVIFSPALNGDANFSSALHPEATFDTPGRYTLKLVATDTESLSDEGTLDVFVGIGGQNEICIGAGSYQSVTLPSYILALDDAWIIPGLTEQMTIEWSVVGAPSDGYVAFADANNWTDANSYSSTSSDFISLASFSPSGDGNGVVTGDYVFQFKVTDVNAVEYTSEATVTVEVNDVSAPEITAFYATIGGQSVEGQQDIEGQIDIYAVIQDQRIKTDGLKLMIDGNDIGDFQVEILEGVPGDIQKLKITKSIHTYYIGSGDHNLTVAAWDSKGNGPTTETISFNLSSVVFETPPVARLTSWTDSNNLYPFNNEDQNEPVSLIDKGVVDFLGAAYFLDGDSEYKPIEYKIELFKQGIENFPESQWIPEWQCYHDYIVANITQDADPNGWRFVETGIPDGGSLGQFDSTGIENGYYRMLLTVRYQDYVSRTSVGFVLDCPLKLGNVRFSQEDTVVPIGGLPIRVVRTYDSLERKKTGPFGYGWSYSIADMEIELNEARAPAPLCGGGTVLVRNSSNFDRDVTLTLPGGKRATFQFYLEPRSGKNPICPAKYKSPPGVKATLEVWRNFEDWPSDELGYPNSFGLWSPQGSVLGYWKWATFYEFPGFMLTTEDGTKYYIKRDYTGEHFLDLLDDTGQALVVSTRGEPYLSMIKTTNGETIEFDINGDDRRIKKILHKDVNDIVTKQLKIVYDGDLVSEIYPPGELNSSGEPKDWAVPALKYDYDEAGNLVKVHRLVDRDSEIYETTTFVYSDEHYITDIVDSRGLTPIQYVYDDAGKLEKVIDAKGSEILLEPDLGSKQQTVTDRLGNVTVYSYDDRGNITGITDANNNTAYYEYNDGNHPDSATVVKVPLVKEPGEEDYAITLTSYDFMGRAVSTTDPVGNVTEYDYDEFGNVTDTKQYRPGPGGPVLVSQAVNTYKIAGSLLLTTEVKDESDYTADRTDYVYNDKNYLEHVIKRYNPDVADDNNLDIITTYWYDQEQSNSHDQPYSISEPYYRYQSPVYLRFFEYDDNGNQVLSRENWTDPKGQDPNLYVFTYNKYDAQGRVTETWQITDNDTDPFGQPDNDCNSVLLSQTAYNDIGKVDTTWDELGNYTQYNYDELGNLTETRSYDSGGTHLTTTQNLYDAEGRVIVTVGPCDPCEPNNVGTETVFDELGRVVETRSFSNVEIQTEYITNAYEEIVGIKSTGWAHGNILSYSRTLYDAAGRVEATISLDEQSNEHVTEYSYDKAGRQITVTDANGNTTLTHYSGNRRDCVVDARGTIDGVDPNDYKTSFDYDALGRVVRTTHPPTEFEGSSGEQKTYNHVAYDGLGRKFWQSDIVAEENAANVPESEKRYFEYDASGRLAATILPEVNDPYNNYQPVRPRYDYFYDDYGNMAGVLDPLDRLTVFEYDEQGRQTKKYMPFTAADANVIYSAADVYAELASAQPQPKCEMSQYDDFGRIVKTTDYKGQITGYIYDGMGRLEDERFYGSDSYYPSEPNMEYVYSYDNLGRKRQADVNDYDNSTTDTYTYDYDNQGRIVAVDDPHWDSMVKYSYSDVTSQTEAVFIGDIYGDTYKNSYEYDELGRLKKVTVNKRANQNVSETSRYTYNPVGSRQSLKYSNNNYAEYQYDALNRLTNLTNYEDNTKTDTVSSYEYRLAADGTRLFCVGEQPCEGEMVENTCEWTYDNLNRLVSEKNYDGTPEQVIDNCYEDTYEYDLAGNRTKKLRNYYGQCTQIDYEYNERNQLVKETHTDPGVCFYLHDKPVFAYAANGRITHYRLYGSSRNIGPFLAWLMGIPTQWSNYIVTAVLGLLPLMFFLPILLSLRGRAQSRPRQSIALWHRSVCVLLAYMMLAEPAGLIQRAYASIAPGDAVFYTYDDNGSLIKKLVADADETDPDTNFEEKTLCSYNLQNRLAEVKVTSDGSNWDITTYKYNPGGIRIKKNVNGTETKYLIDSYNHTGYAQVFLERTAPNTTAYVIGSEVLTQAVGTNSAKCLLCDGHGSVRQVANSDGSVPYGQSHYYDAYGNFMDGWSDEPDSNLRYTGQYFDTDVQQYYLRARWYNPSNGLFNRIDPYSGNYSDPQSLHKYLYCHANPLNATDPSGLMTLLNVAITNAIIGALIGGLIGGIDSALGGGNFWEGFGLGALFGGIAGAASVFLPMTLLIKALLGGVVVTSTAVGAFGSFKSGHTLQGFFRILVGLVSLGLLVKAPIRPSAYKINKQIRISRLKALKNIGFSKMEAEEMLAGKVVISRFKSPEGVYTEVISQYANGRLKVGITYVEDTTGTGARTLGSFRRFAFDIARAYKVKEVDLFGAKVDNPELRAMLIRQGFESAILGKRDVLVKTVNVP